MAVAFQLGLGLVRLYLAYMKYFLEHILTIGFQFREPPRGALHQGNFDFLSLTHLMNTLLVT